MWNDLVQMGVTWPDKLIRTLVVYFVLALLIRLAGKRDLAQLNAFDLVVMLLLSNVVQNAVIGPDNSLVGGVLGALILVAANAAMVRLVRTNDTAARWLEGTSTVLARGGHWVSGALRREGLRQSDVEAALRRQNAYGVEDLDELTIEPGGAIVATLRPELQTVTKQDLDRLEAKIDALLAR